MDLAELKKKMADNELTFAEMSTAIDLLVKLSNDNEEFQEDFGEKSKVYQFAVSDKPEAEWLWMKLDKGKITAGRGKCPHKVDLTFTQSAQLAADMVSGKVDSNSAFLKGDLKITGNIKDGVLFQKMMAAWRDILDV